MKGSGGGEIARTKMRETKRAWRGWRMKQEQAKLQSERSAAERDECKLTENCGSKWLKIFNDYKRNKIEDKGF